MQNITNTAWASSTMCRLDEKMFESLARTAKLLLNKVNALSATNAAWTVTIMCQLDEEAPLGYLGIRYLRHSGKVLWYRESTSVTT